MRKLKVTDGLGSSHYNMIKLNIPITIGTKKTLGKTPDFNKTDFDSLELELSAADESAELASINFEDDWEALVRLNQVQANFIPLKLGDKSY